MLYEKPVWQLMADAVRELQAPFSADDIQEWFAENRPLVRPTTVVLHIEGLTANHPSRPGHKNLRRKPPVLWLRIDRLHEPYDPAKHGPYVVYSGESRRSQRDEEQPDSGEQRPEPSRRLEFALETYLEGFMRQNWSRINWTRDLQIWESPERVSGWQYTTPVGRIDFLCIDPATGWFVVVELKRGRPADDTVGQIMRYMGWVSHNLAGEEKRVDGIIIAHEIDDRLIYAARPVPGLLLMRYEVDFRLIPVD